MLRLWSVLLGILAALGLGGCPRSGYSQALELVEALSDEPCHPWYEAGKEFQKLGREGISVLEQVLQGDIKVRYRNCVCYALGNMQSKRSLDLLITALEDRDDMVKLGAAENLGNRANVRAVAPLVQLLRSGSYESAATGIHACWSLELITEENFGVPHNPFGSGVQSQKEAEQWAESAAQAAERILKWWEAEGKARYGTTRKGDP